MSGGHARWRSATLPLVSLAILIPNVIRSSGILSDAWPVWRPAILDALLVVAGAVLVAGLAFGIHAWRGAQRHA